MECSEFVPLISRIISRGSVPTENIQAGKGLFKGETWKAVGKKSNSKKKNLSIQTQKPPIGKTSDRKCSLLLKQSEQRSKTPLNQNNTPMLFSVSLNKNILSKSLSSFIVARPRLMCCIFVFLYFFLKKKGNSCFYRHLLGADWLGNISTNQIHTVDCKI